MFFVNEKMAQGTVEYLVIIAVVVVLSLVVVGLFTGMFSNSSQQIIASSDSFSSISGGIRIVESVIDEEGDSLIRFSNNSSDTITLTKITVGGVPNDFSEQVVANDSKTFSLSDLVSGCKCLSGQKSVSCEYVINYIQNGLAKTDRLTKTIECVNDSVPVNSTSVVGLGSGTLTDPWIINSCLELQDMNLRLDGNYALGADINCYSDTQSGGILYNNGSGFIPVGFTTSAKFTGSFNGNNHKIYSLYIYRPNGAGVGLFGYTSATALVRNVGVVDQNTIGYWDTGSLVGHNYGLVMNSYSSGTVSASPSHLSDGLGGLVGTNDYGSVLNSYNLANVTGYKNIGGIVGWNYHGIVSNSFNNGTIYGVYSQIGGLIGYNNQGAISNSYSTGSVTSNRNIGGLVGLNNNNGGVNGSISNCFSTGIVTAVGGNQTSFNGLVGANNDGVINNSYWDIGLTTQANCFTLGTGVCTPTNSQVTEYYGSLGVAKLNNDGNWVAVAGDYPKLSWQ